MTDGRAVYRRLLGYVGAHWTVLRDPAGGVYCLTARDPGTGTLSAR